MLTIRGTAEEIESVKEVFTHKVCDVLDIIECPHRGCDNCLEESINWEVTDE